ncbi:MAG: homoserine dehydrogenase [Clostridia bacterium]|nr:homoserine dehydrogenase [Clostridia bacterium]
MIQIAILGHGVVGTGTARMIEDNAAYIEKLVGEEVRVKYILDIRDLPDSPWADRIVHDFSVILEDKEVALVAELIGGSHPAFDFQKAALEAGKHVVTSNKECVSKFGDTLLKIAAERGVCYRFEASCGGGIPLLSPLCSDLAVNRITEVSGILNGTTNSILTKMFKEKADFADALKEAQEKGYAERNPAADIEGTDACRKINIISACVTGILHDDSKIPTEGITAVRTTDVLSAHKAGYAVKLLGRMTGEHLYVAPHLVPYTCPLSHADDVFNAALAHGNFVGDVMFYGRGAGAEPTAAAVVSDIAYALKGIPCTTVWERKEEVADFAAFACPRYLACAQSDAKALTEALSCSFERVDATEDEFACLTASLTEAEVAQIKEKISLRAHLRVWESAK